MTRKFLHQFLNTYFDDSFDNFTVFLEIDFPILFSIEKNNKTFLFYTIHHKYLKKQFAAICTKVPFKIDLLDLVAGRISVRDFFLKFDKNEKSYVEFNGETIIDTIFNFSDKIDHLPSTNINDFILTKNKLIFEDLLPLNDLFLNSAISNKIETDFLYEKLIRLYFVDSNLYQFTLDFQKNFSQEIDAFQVLLDVENPIIFAFSLGEETFVCCRITDEISKQTILISKLQSVNFLISCLNGEFSFGELIDKHTFAQHFLYIKSNEKFSFSSFGLSFPVNSFDGLDDFYNQDLFFEDLFPDEDFFFKKELVNRISLSHCISSIEKFF